MGQRRGCISWTFPRLNGLSSANNGTHHVGTGQRWLIKYDMSPFTTGLGGPGEAAQDN